MKLIFVAILSFQLIACATTNDSYRQELIDLHTKAREAYSAKDWELAGKYYYQITQQVPKDSETWYRLGNIYARLNRPADAVAVYREALVRDSKHARAWHNLSVMHLRQSAATLIEMQRHVRNTDPLYTVAQQKLESIYRLLGKSSNQLNLQQSELSQTKGQLSGPGKQDAAL